MIHGTACRGSGFPTRGGDFLGLDSARRPVESFFEICLMEEMTVEGAVRYVLEKTRPLGQDCALVLGDRKKKVRRLAIGTGAISNAVLMSELKPDCALTVDDRINTPGISHWAVDRGMPLLFVRHPVSEYSGMMAMARYLGEQFPDTPAEYLDVAFPYSTIVG